MGHDGFTVLLGGLDLTAESDDLGVSWRTFSPLSGWGGSPGSSIQLNQKPRSPGAWVSSRQLTPRTLPLNGLAECPDVDTLRICQDRLNAAATLDSTRLVVTEGAATRWCNVYRQDEVLAEAVTDTLLQWSIQMVAADPRKFSDELTAATGLPSTSGGLTIPYTVPYSIASTVVAGYCALTNPGNTTGPVRLRIDGPVVGPVVTHVATGLQVVFSSSLTIPSGQYLTVDMENQATLANGQASRNGYVVNRGWFGFDPGPNVFSFSAVSGTGQLTVSATPAWL
jgi:hypothetical protein